MAGYLYDPAGNVVAETDGSGAVVMQFGYDDLGHLAIVQRGGTTYRVLTDATGSPRFVINTSSGTVVDAITYDAWGRITSESAPGTIPFGFAGGLADPDTGLVHFGARDYDPTTGTWTGPDPIQFAGGGPNLYQYAGSDPVNIVDPSGLDGLVVGACLGRNGKITGTDVAECGEGDLMINSHTIPWPPASTTQPAVPPETPPVNPSGPSAPTVTCTGLACRFPPPAAGGYQSYCILGTCSNGPSGFSCTAVLCAGPKGGMCELCSVGDTHLRTGDGVHVDFQGAGEFVALMSPDGKVAVQARQESWTPSSSVSNNTAVATSVDGDRVGVYSREPAFLMVNGTAMNAPDIEERLPHGGLLERHGGQVVVTWPEGSRLTVTRLADTLNYGFTPSAAVGTTLRGLLGSEDGNPGNDLTGRDGAVLIPSDPAFKTKLYQPFGNSWRISQPESLFDYQPGESTATFTHLDFPSSTTTVASLDPAARTRAEAVCRALGVESAPWLDDCILDVGVTGDPSFAESEAGMVAAGAPTTVPGSSAATAITIGQAVTGAINATSQHFDYTFAATAGEVVYLQAQATCASDPLSWKLLGPDGSLVDVAESCNDLGRHVLPAAGIYTVEIYSSGSVTGPYAFTVRRSQ